MSRERMSSFMLAIKATRDAPKSGSATPLAASLPVDLKQPLQAP
jgi:hypothetical protein